MRASIDRVAANRRPSGAPLEPMRDMRELLGVRVGTAILAGNVKTAGSSVSVPITGDPS